MFDLGFSELFLIAIVALIVLGPERLPKAARFVGLWLRRARAQWHSVKSEFESELADEDLKRTLRQTRDDLREARDSVVQSGQEMQREFAEIESNARALGEPSAPGPASAPATDHAEPEASSAESVHDDGAVENAEPHEPQEPSVAHEDAAPYLSEEPHGQR